MSDIDNKEIVVPLWKGRYVQPSKQTPDPDVVKGVEELLERARAGEIIGFQVQIMNWDKTVGSCGFGWRSPALIGEMFIAMQRITTVVEKA